jgi:uncharacterized protein YbjT (DUF2867 family)
MADRKIIAVMGATGAQGGGLVRAILRDEGGPFAARAITRNPSSDSAKALADQGVEVVEASLDEPASVAKAFAGAYGAFCVSFFWEHFSPGKETAHARVMAEAAKEAGLKHVIWSTFEDTRDFVPLDDDRMPTLQGAYKVPHFDAKAEGNQAFRDAGVPTTFLLTSFYWDNFIFFGTGPKRGPDGRLALTMPIGDAKMPGIAAEDIGRAAYGIFKANGDLIGQTIGVAGDHTSGAEMAAGLTEVLGEVVAYNEVSPEVYRSFGFPGADDMGNMFQFKRDFEDAYRAARSVERTRELNPLLQSYREWLEANASRIPLD